MLPPAALDVKVQLRTMTVLDWLQIAPPVEALLFSKVQRTIWPPLPLLIAPPNVPPALLRNTQSVMFAAPAMAPPPAVPNIATTLPSNTQLEIDGRESAQS